MVAINDASVEKNFHNDFMAKWRAAEASHGSPTPAQPCG
jgi:hypothetical protein